MTKRLEITLSDETWSALNAARGHEPRASFVKRHLERALAEQPSIHIPGFGSVPDDESGRRVARAAADAREVSESQGYVDGALVAVEDAEPVSGCPECSGDMQYVPGTTTRACSDCGFTERS